MAEPVAPRSAPPQIDGDGDATIAFYNREAETYFGRTLSSDVADKRRRFLKGVPSGGRILDAGSGSGRDTLAFVEAGYRVEAFDASSRLARLAQSVTGLPVEVVRFERWRGEPARYDGVWCFASLLHVGGNDLPAVLYKLATSLKPGGALFASFKRGQGTIVDWTGRRFTNLTMDTARSLFGAVEGLGKPEVWEEDGPTALDGPMGWVYVLSRRLPERP